MTYTLYTGSCLDILPVLPAKSVHTCVTSPPYFGLRDYGVDGQIGLEDTPEQYVTRMVEVFRQVHRVLRDDGTLWLNLGDSWAGSNRGVMSDGSVVGGKKQRTNQGAMNGAIRKSGTFDGIKAKDLIGIPWMVAFALRADGWYLRSDCIWSKPNPMPESVRDRPTKAHEYIFLLSKSARYYYDAEAIKEPAKEHTGRAAMFARSGAVSEHVLPGQSAAVHRTGRTDKVDAINGRNKRSVWTVTPKPYKGAHFATFPPDLIEPCILAGTSAEGVCGACGAQWVRVVEVIGRERQRWAKGAAVIESQYGAVGKTSVLATAEIAVKQTVGWRPACNCNAERVPATVLDPFSGSGTTGMVAVRNGRSYIGIDLNSEYNAMARERIGKAERQLSSTEASTHG